MLSITQQHASREFLALLRRAMRVGWLDPYALLASYAELQPVAHLGISDPLHLDLEAFEQHLRALPVGLFDAHSILVAASLGDDYQRPASANNVLCAAVLDDATILIEAKHGLASLAQLAAHLCAVAHEQTKAWELLAAAPHAACDANDGVDDPASQLLTTLALALGVDPYHLAAADERCQGELWRALRPEKTVPSVRIHDALHPDAVAAHYGRVAERVVASLAEMGLAQRPLHLWLGDDPITHCLSPYVRDLHDVLLQWAGANPPGLGADLPRPHPGIVDSQAYLCAVTHDFLCLSEPLQAERRAADRSVGILRSNETAPGFDLIDLGRLDATACDARLPRWRFEAPAPVLVRVAPDFADADASLVAGLLSMLGARIVSVTVVARGATLSGDDGSVVLPRLIVGWDGDQKWVWPGSSGLGVETWPAAVQPVAQAGVLLTTPCAELLAANCLENAPLVAGVACIESGSASASLAALIDGYWAGQLAAETDVACTVITGDRAPSGRDRLGALAAEMALVVVRLRQLLRPWEQPTAADRQPPPPPDRAPNAAGDRVRRAAGPPLTGQRRPIRIKA